MSIARKIAAALVALAVPALVAAAAQPADAAFPGRQGKIVFSKTSRYGGGAEIFLMNANGVGHVQLTRNGTYDGVPTFSPDGGRIAFESSRSADREGDIDIYTMRTDASGLTQLTFSVGFDADPAWSPDGM